ncbi:MAG: ATP-binding protein [Arcobacteraceae bacterium]
MNNFFIKLRLIKKISFLVVLAIVISQLTHMVFFEYFLKESYTKEAITKIKYVKDIIKEDILQTQDELKKGIALVDSDESILASLYFINNYQDKNNYNASLLDEEKKRISEELLDRVKLSLNDIIAFYDINSELIAYVIKTEKGYKQNFISYINGILTLYSKYENEKKYKIDEFKDNNIISLTHKDYYTLEPTLNSIITYQNTNQNLVIKSHRSIENNNIIIGHMELNKIYTKEYFIKISDRTNIKVFFSSLYNDPLISSNIFSEKKDSFKIQKTEKSIFSNVYIDNLNNNCNILFDLDSKYLKNAISESRMDSFVSGIITIMLILFILYILLKNNLITPLKQIMEQIKKIETNDYSETPVLHTKDELELISKNINTLAITIQNREESIIEEKVKSEKAQKQLYKSEKLASMGEMIGNIAHQWRQPLSVISTAATGMKLQKEYDCLSDEVFNKSCSTINENAQYLSKTIDDFKNFIKGEREKKIFKVNDNIQSFLHLVDGPIKNNNIKIVLNLENDLEINGYENELIQCFINIFNNAKDALKDTPLDNKYLFIKCYKEDNLLILKFTDTANGISEDILPRIFEPYFTTKHQSQGTGLGLHMTYNLITDGMKGEITVQNINFNYMKKSYSGAEFTITLPLNIN